MKSVRSLWMLWQNHAVDQIRGGLKQHCDVLNRDYLLGLLLGNWGVGIVLWGWIFMRY